VGRRQRGANARPETGLAAMISGAARMSPTRFVRLRPAARPRRWQQYLVALAAAVSTGAVAALTVAGASAAVLPPGPLPSQPQPATRAGLRLLRGSGVRDGPPSWEGAAASGRRWTVAAAAAALGSLVCAAAASANIEGLKKTERVQYSATENAGLPSQSNRDVANYLDFGDGLKVSRLDVPKAAPGDPEAGREVKVGDRVTIDCIGYLAGWNGVVFMRTQDKSGYSEYPVTFTVGSDSAILGLDRGVVGMVKGEKRRLVIPGKLGYPRPLVEEDLGKKPRTLPNPMESNSANGAPWELRNRLLNGVVNNSQRDDTLVIDVKMKRIG